MFRTVATKIPKTLVSGSKSLGATGFRNLGTVHGQGVEQRMVEIYTKSWMVFVRENPNLKWMIAGGTPMDWTPPFDRYIFLLDVVVLLYFSIGFRHLKCFPVFSIPYSAPLNVELRFISVYTLG